LSTFASRAVWKGKERRLKVKTRKNFTKQKKQILLTIQTLPRKTKNRCNQHANSQCIQHAFGSNLIRFNIKLVQNK